jgi:hypothetical protein
LKSQIKSLWVRGKQFLNYKESGITKEGLKNMKESLINSEYLEEINMDGNKI